MKLVILSLMALGIASAAGPYDRQWNQQSRIYQGARSGSLTRGETAYLEHREAALHREIRRDRIDGGRLTARERVKIDRQQDRMSNRIYNLKHNNRYR